MKLLLFCCLSVLPLVAVGKVSYEGYKVYEAVPKNTEQLKVLHKLSKRMDVDFWKFPGHVGGVAHIMVPPQRVAVIERHLVVAGITYTIVNDNVQALIDAEAKGMKERPETQAYDYMNYNTYAEFQYELDVLASQCPNGFTCKTYTLGNSYEMRPIKALSVLKDVAGPRPTVWMDSLIHAREWLAGATLMNIIHTLIHNYTTDTDAQRLMDNFDWYFVPVMNPDGYDWTWTDDRLWRKSRNDNDLDPYQPGMNDTCKGTDLNRNYDFMWGGGGSSDLPCMATYAGSAPMSEPETQAAAIEIMRISDVLLLMVTVHTYGQYWLHPFGHMVEDVCVRAPNHEEMYRVADLTANATEAAYGTEWLRGNICEVLYEASGTTVDWNYVNSGATYSYTPELRGPFFTPGVDAIVPSYEEIWAGLVVMCDSVQRLEPLT